VNINPGIRLSRMRFVLIGMVLVLAGLPPYVRFFVKAPLPEILP